jgi:hypothetical protein
MPARAADLVDGQVLDTLLPNSPLTVSDAPPTGPQYSLC